MKSLLSKLLTLPYADKKNSCIALRLHTNDILLLTLFQPITAWLFSIAACFLVLSMLTILLDRCQMKSFEDINISEHILCHQVGCTSVFYCSAGVKANFKYKKLKNSQRFNSKLTAFIRAKMSKMS